MNIIFCISEYSRGFDDNVNNRLIREKFNPAVVCTNRVSEALDNIPQQIPYILILTQYILSDPDLKTGEELLEVYLAKQARLKNPNCSIVFWREDDDKFEEDFDATFNMLEKDSFHNLIAHIKKFFT